MHRVNILQWVQMGSCSSMGVCHYFLWAKAVLHLWNHGNNACFLFLVFLLFRSTGFYSLIWWNASGKYRPTAHAKLPLNYKKIDVQKQYKIHLVWILWDCNIYDADLPYIHTCLIYYICSCPCLCNKACCISAATDAWYICFFKLITVWPSWIRTSAKEEIKINLLKQREKYLISEQ